MSHEQLVRRSTEQFEQLEPARPNGCFALFKKTENCPLRIGLSPLAPRVAVA
jgi:hypothetical protein